MPTAPANGLEIYYETFGDRDGEPLLLVNGLGSQCISYEPDFCNAFVDRGFFVIRFDNRDVGFSTKIDTPHIDFAPLLAKAFAGERVDAPYVLSDMAADAVGLLDHLGIDAAHIVGMSMGGMVVQTIAVEHPERVRTMTSIMSTTGDRDVGTSTPEAAAVLVAPPATSRDEYLANYLEQWKILSGPVYYDEARFRRRARCSLRPLLLPARYREAAAGDHRVGLEEQRVAHARRPHARHPRQDRPARHRHGRRAHG